MLKKKKKENTDTPENINVADQENILDDQEQTETAGQEPVATLSAEDKLKEELAQANDKYLRLYAEYDNFRKRSARRILPALLKWHLRPEHRLLRPRNQLRRIVRAELGLGLLRKEAGQ